MVYGVAICFGVDHAMRRRGKTKKTHPHERRHAPKRTSNSVSASTHEIGKSNISKNDKQRVSGRTE